MSLRIIIGPPLQWPGAKPFIEKPGQHADTLLWPEESDPSWTRLELSSGTLEMAATTIVGHGIRYYVGTDPAVLWTNGNIEGLREIIAAQTSVVFEHELIGRSVYIREGGRWNVSNDKANRVGDKERAMKISTDTLRTAIEDAACRADEAKRHRVEIARALLPAFKIGDRVRLAIQTSASPGVPTLIICADNSTEPRWKCSGIRNGLRHLDSYYTAELVKETE